MSEITYDIKTDLSLVNESVFTVLNNITGYNHLMTFQEQVVKNDLRLKFILESLSILHKTFKNKSSNSLKLKSTIISCLIVIDSLTNFKGQSSGKLNAVSKDNYYNSIRDAVVRENVP